MVDVQYGVQRTEAIRQGARHKLYVEGATDRPGTGHKPRFDVSVIAELLRGMVEVQPLGASFSVSAVAEALYPYNPDHYFLVDRDHQEDAVVERSWDNFPNQQTNNLLIWRRRELESYFVLSSYLEHIPMADGDNPRRIKTVEQIDDLVVRNFRKRLFMDAANQIIVKIREGNKANWIKCFENPGELPDAETARQKLLDHPAFTEKCKGLKKQTGRRELTARFKAVLHELTGDDVTLSFDTGNWIERLRAKAVWNTVANQCFTVVDRDGEEVRGSEKARQIGLALVRRPLNEQPEDFQELHRLISTRTGA